MQIFGKEHFSFILVFIIILSISSIFVAVIDESAFDFS